jgi:hypothetical protein
MEWLGNFKKQVLEFDSFFISFPQTTPIDES